MIRSEIKEVIKTSNIANSWAGLSLASQEIAQVEKELNRLQEKVSTLDKLNVFTDTPEEARIKECRERIKLRQKEFENYTKITGEFISELGEQFPDFKVATHLEAFFRESIECSKPGDFKSLAQTIRKWLGPLLKELEGLKEAPEGSDILEQLVIGPYQHTRRALLCLLSISPLLEIIKEDQWEGSAKILSFRPLIFRLVENCRQAFKEDCEGVPLPCEIHQGLTDHKDKSQDDPIGNQLRAGISTELEEHFQSLLKLNRTLAGYRTLIELNSSEISTLDRVAFWSDTKAESREKGWKSQITELEASMKSLWQKLCLANKKARTEVWLTFLLDFGYRVKSSVSQIKAAKPKGLVFKTTSVLFREEPLLLVDKFRTALLRKYSYPQDFSELRNHALQVTERQAPLETDALGNPPVFQKGDLIAQVGSRFLEMKFHEEVQETDSEILKLEEEKQESDRGYQEKDIIEKLSHMIVKTIMAPRSREARRYRDSKRPEAQIYRKFFQLVGDVHSPTALHILLHELSYRLSAITASIPVSRASSSGRRTTPSAKLHGHKTALETAGQIHAMISKICRDCPFPLGGLECCATGQVVSSIIAHPFKVKLP